MPVKIDRIQPGFLIISIVALVVYFLFGIILLSYVPMDAISSATTSTCQNDTGNWASKHSNGVQA